MFTRLNSDFMEGGRVGKILMQAFAIPESGELPGDVKAVGVWMSYSVH